MENETQLVNWIDGFTKIAEQHGITSPTEIQELLKLSWHLEMAETDPIAFDRAFDTEFDRLNTKQAGVVSSLVGAIRKLRTPALLATGGAAALGGGATLSAAGGAIADNVELNKARRLAELTAEAQGRPLRSTPATPYAGARV